MLIEVVAAVFSRGDRVLCLRRSSGRSMAGCWEFAGGKVEAFESLTDALVREIKEELKVDIEVGEYLGENIHPTDDGQVGARQIRLHAFMVESWSGQIELIDHDRMLWATTQQMRALEWSQADVPFVELMCTTHLGS